MMPPIRAAGLPVTPWKNGAGRKADIAAGPGWTLGYAWLDGDAAFSDYGGHDRTITLVEGAGFTLGDPAGLARVTVQHLHRPAAFDGGTTLFCRVTAGPCRVLNVMTARAEAGHTMEMMGDEPRLIAAPPPGHAVMLVCLRGTLAVETADTRHVLATFDAAAVTEPLRAAPGSGSAFCRITLWPISTAEPDGRTA